MNTDILRGKWTQLKGQVKQRWAKLTDDDIKYMEGNLQNAAGRLQERYGIAREQAEREWEEFVGSAGGANAAGANPAGANPAGSKPAQGGRQDNPTGGQTNPAGRPNEPGRQQQGGTAGRSANPNPNPGRSGNADDSENEQGV